MSSSSIHFVVRPCDDHAEDGTWVRTWDVVRVTPEQRRRARRRDERLPGTCVAQGFRTRALARAEARRLGEGQ